MADDNTKNELLIISTEGTVILKSAKQKGDILVANESIVATITKVLYLFSRKVMKEQINFIRFDNHRMIFTASSETGTNLFAVKLVSKDALARDFLPAMKIVLNAANYRYSHNDLPDPAKKSLNYFYQLLCSPPEEVAIIAPYTIEGMMALVILIGGLVYDLGWSLTKAVQNVRLVENDQIIPAPLPDTVKYALSLSPSSVIKGDIEVCTIGVDNHTDLISTAETEKIFTTCSKIFGEGTSAAKFNQLLTTDKDVLEVFETVKRIPRDYNGVEIAMNAIISAIRDPANIIVALSKPVIERLKQFEEEGIKGIASDSKVLSKIAVESVEPTLATVSTSEPVKEPVVSSETSMPSNATVPVTQETGMVEDPDAILKQMTAAFESEQLQKAAEIKEPSQPAMLASDDSQPLMDESVVNSLESLASEGMLPDEESQSESIQEPIEVEPAVVREAQSVATPVEPTPPQETVRSEIPVTPKPETTVVALPEVSAPGSVISQALLAFRDIPITINTSSYMSGHSALHKLLSKEIQMELLAPDDNENIHVLIHVGEARNNEYIQSISDLLTRVQGAILQSGSTIVIKMPVKSLYTCFRGLVWSIIVEYLNQVAEGKAEKSAGLKIPNNGSVMLIPPGRDFIREKLPRQIKKIVEEDKIISELETESVHTIVLVINRLLQEVFDPLKVGTGVAIIPRASSQEMPEITLSLILVSEITGIAFSRW